MQLTHITAIFKELHAAHTHLENAIMRVPTSEIRNQLTEANILVLSVIQFLENVRESK